MIQWYVIFLILVAEAVTLTMLILPLPLSVKRSFMKLFT
jgi:hypothetical protein